ncbi:MAG TPA: 2-oxo-4-hydroxy-4-carboxy-5-ureidoimidazoline decarboxylase [Woeseiaceae bacterium]
MTSASSRNLAAFVARYGGVYEHSPWVAEQCFVAAAGNPDAAGLAGIFAACVDRADRATKLALIRAHPDLAGRAAVRGELTADSTGEQASAGINQCSPEEFRRFQEFNELYKSTFDFPFVMAVRNSNRHEILAAFERRLQNDREQEFAQAISEIHKIARMRLESIFRESSAA